MTNKLDLEGILKSTQIGNINNILRDLQKIESLIDSDEGGHFLVVIKSATLRVKPTADSDSLAAVFQTNF